MTEELVSFETAKLAKEKGFDVPSTHYYFEDGEFKVNSIKDFVGMDYGAEVEYELSEFEENWNDKGVTKKNGSRCFGCSKNKGYFETFSAPTQSLLQKWLREIHDIEVYVPTTSIGSDDSEYQYCIRWEKFANEKREHNRYEIIESLQFYPGGYTNKAYPMVNSYEGTLEKGLLEALKLIK